MSKSQKACQRRVWTGNGGWGKVPPAQLDPAPWESYLGRRTKKGMNNSTDDV